MNGFNQVGLRAASFESYDPEGPVTGVRLIIDDENEYFAGSEDGLVWEITNPYGTQAIADYILAQAQGNPYYGFKATKAALVPEAELGDGVEVNGTTSVLAYRKVTFSPGHRSTIAAPGSGDEESEYPYLSREKRQTNRKLAQTRAAIEKSAEEVRAYVESEVDDALAEVDVKLDSIKLEVSQEAGADGRVYARLTLTVGPNKYSGLITVDGNLQVNGQLSADALYAAMGDIADLTVNRLSTSRRIVLYLKRDRSDDNFVRVQDQYIEFVTGETDGSTEQAVNPSGLPIYWEDDPDGATLGTDGYPYRDGQRIFITTKVTPWPVTVYQYTEGVKSSIGFELVDGIYTPVYYFGAGGEDGVKRRARLVKGRDSLDLIYTTSNNTEIGFRARDDGHMDLYGLRKTVGLDFSGWDAGTFTEAVAGIEDPYSYRVEFDDEGRPIKISDDTGFELAVTW